MAKYLPISLSFFCLFVFLGCTESPEAKKETLKVAVRKVNEAIMKEDLAFLEQMMTEGYQHSIDVEKTIDKDTLIYHLQNRKAQLASGELKILRFTMNDIEMDISDRSAWVTGKVQVRIQNKESIKNYEYRVRHLWLLEKGSWKRTGFYNPKTH